MSTLQLAETRAQLMAFCERHEQVALLFSGGKDSLACLELLRPVIEKVTVIWSNPGDPYPETISLMERIKRSVPSFVEAKGAVHSFHQDFGWPVDMVPFESTPLGRMCAGDTPEPKLVQLDQCCNANMWLPLFEALRGSDATGCVRGDKRVDEWRPRFESNASINGVEYHLPLMEWVDQDVFKFIGDAVPASYSRGHPASFDCMSCTAYLQHNPGRVRELGEKYPVAYNAVHKVLWHQREKTFKYLTRLVEEGVR